MGDRVSPLIQFFKFPFPFRIVWIKIAHLVPELDAQNSKVRLDATRLRISTIELSSPDKPSLDERTHQ